jgi:predicted dinucleotide-binding enzyme
MRLGIIGAGFIGRAVARLAVKNGYEVMLSNSRGPRTLGSTMVSVGCAVGTTADAAAFGELVLLAIPFSSTHDLDPTLFAGKIVMDADNYYPARDGPIAELEDHSATTSEITQRHLAAATVVKAFNAILERDIEADARETGAPDRRALPLAGDDPEAKKKVAGFLDKLGYDVVDGGSLAEGWRFERARPAYCVKLNKARLREALREAGRLVSEGSWRT